MSETQSFMKAIRTSVEIREEIGTLPLNSCFVQTLTRIALWIISEVRKRPQKAEAAILRSPKPKTIVMAGTDHC
jgi:hypothetical protein